ncbi:unnamed protein product [Echinostoma caproni]|uniref:Hydrocephalus-inducing protein homolog n=1 Tax=Echinostoma caproni TaxID=27848 RepID=A0A182ZZM4_9TREM|nr:unnamed protein product [Echinostoma caproni]
MALITENNDFKISESLKEQFLSVGGVHTLTPSEYETYIKFSSKNYWKNLRFVFPPEITALNVLDVVSPDKPYPTDLQLCKDVPFSVEPIEGVVRPHSEKEIVISFSPEKAKEYHNVLYCDVEGRSVRLKLNLTGLGVGPKVKFSFSCLDMGKVFIGSKHSYELVLSNVGFIDAICFNLTPDDGLINPGGYQAIQIDFCSPGQLGPFSESFEILCDGCLQSDTILLRGEVVGPTFHFDVNEVDFGQVSHGEWSVSPRITTSELIGLLALYTL